MPVPDGENVLLVKQHQLLVVDDATIQFSVIRLTQGDDMYLDRTVLKWKITVALIFRTYRSILHHDLELGVLLAHDGQLDANIATFVTSQQTLLEM